MWHFHTCSIWVAIKVQPKLSKQLSDILDNDPYAFFLKPTFIKWQEGIITLQCSSIREVSSRKSCTSILPSSNFVFSFNRRQSMMTKWRRRRRVEWDWSETSLQKLVDAVKALWCILFFFFLLRIPAFSNELSLRYGPPHCFPLSFSSLAVNSP